MKKAAVLLAFVAVAFGIQLNNFKGEVQTDAPGYFCAREHTGKACVCTGTVHCGAVDKWNSKAITGSTPCSNAVFGDPIHGTVKNCYCVPGVAAGPAGSAGSAGPAGKDGDKGDKGDKGGKGDKGDKGTNGDKGAKGEQGEQGTNGDKGAKGEQGEQGTAGKDGSAGSAGSAGPAGPAGPAGVGVAVSHLAPVCEHSTAHLACKNGGSINIVSASYGRTDGSTCPKRKKKKKKEKKKKKKKKMNS